MTGSHAVHTDAKTQGRQSSQGVRGPTWQRDLEGRLRADSRDTNEATGVISTWKNGLEWGQMFPIKRRAGLERHKTLFVKSLVDSCLEFRTYGGAHKVHDSSYREVPYLLKEGETRSCRCKRNQRSYRRCCDADVRSPQAHAPLFFTGVTVTLQGWLKAQACRDPYSQLMSSATGA